MDLLNRVLDKVAEVANEAYLEFSRWVDRLDDMEKLFFMVVFILILFMLILVRAGRRKADPARGAILRLVDRPGDAVQLRCGMDD